MAAQKDKIAWGTRTGIKANNAVLDNRLPVPSQKCFPQIQPLTRSRKRAAGSRCQTFDVIQMKTLLAGLLFLNILSPLIAEESAPSFSTGIKIGEVSQNTAIIWSRLTSNTLKGSNSNMKHKYNGVPGRVQVSYWPEGAQQEMTELQPVAVDRQKDFSCQIMLNELKPNTKYRAKVTALSESGFKGQELMARFKTAPRPEQISDVEAVVVTCQGHETIDDPDKGHWVYSHMLTLEPDFFIHTGDVVYYDKGEALPLSKTVTAARQRWNLMFSYDWNRDFHAEVSSYFMKDDHDTLRNDCWPGQTYGEITWEEGLALFKEQTPQGPLPYRSVRWGKDLEFWLIEGRDFRSPNNIPDGPEKNDSWRKTKGMAHEGAQRIGCYIQISGLPIACSRAR